MAFPSVIIVSGYGINCEEETKLAFETVGAKTEVVHLSSLLRDPQILDSYNIIVFPGGFSFSDYTGSGKIMSFLLSGKLSEKLLEFIYVKKRLILGICNGCQILVKAGFIRNKEKKRNISVVENDTGQYSCHWVTINRNVQSFTSPWLYNIDDMYIPVAHGEGKFVTDSSFNASNVAFRYKSDSKYKDKSCFNGSDDNIAGLIDDSGLVLAMMPHPERSLFTNQRDDYYLIREIHSRKGMPVPEYGDGVNIFQNAVRYFE